MKKIFILNAQRSYEAHSHSSCFYLLNFYLLYFFIFSVDFQVLVKLCSHAAPAEELSRKDDLMLLFSAITSSCPSYNVLWRKSAAEVLMTISRHGLTQPVVAYIHSKFCSFDFHFILFLGT